MNRLLEATRSSPRDLIGSRFGDLLVSESLIHRHDLQIAGGYAERQRISVVDDDRITRMLVKLLLEKEGYEAFEPQVLLSRVRAAFRRIDHAIVAA